MRLLSDIAWIILLTITPWWLFERLLLSDCERAVCKRWVFYRRPPEGKADA
jgi:hypothetical protein